MTPSIVPHRKSKFQKIGAKFSYFFERYVLCMGDKTRFLRRKGVRIGNDCSIITEIKYFNIDSEPWLIRLGDKVTIADDVMFVNHDGSSRLFRHLIPNSSRYGNRFGKIDIKDNCFIGARSLILPDVEIGPNSIVGAGSVVNKNVPPNSVYAGVPAKFICTLDDYVERYQQKMIPIESTNREDLKAELIEKIWK